MEESAEKSAQPEVRICCFYATGKTEKELLAYDEYDSNGDGRYFTDDTYMCDRYVYSEAQKIAKELNLNVFIVTITAIGKNKKTEIDIPHALEDMALRKDAIEASNE